MDIYLPIAAISQNVFLLLFLGLGVGFLSGLLGVGGGFLLTPLLIFIGVPQAVAVGSSANQLVGASFSGVLGYWRRGAVDFKMATFLISGGVVGSGLGVFMFRLLRHIGQIDLVISLGYVLLLGTLGTLMLIESIRAMLRAGRPGARRRRFRQRSWIHGLPFKTRFRQSKLYISALLPLGIGMGIGILSSLLGVGGGFLIVPAMIYVLGMPASMVPGTSLLQTAFIAASVTILQAWTNQTVDGVLTMILLIGGIIGVQYGVRYGVKLRGEYLRAILALVILALGAKLLMDLARTPDNPYALSLIP